MHPPMGIAACRWRSSLFAAFATATPGGIEMVTLTAPRHRWVMAAPDPCEAQQPSPAQPARRPVTPGTGASGPANHAAAVSAWNFLMIG